MCARSALSQPCLQHLMAGHACVLCVQVCSYVMEGILNQGQQGRAKQASLLTKSALSQPLFTTPLGSFHYYSYTRFRFQLSDL